ncbi:hypothetical protein ACVW1L_000001 [Ewingella americana]
MCGLSTLQNQRDVTTQRTTYRQLMGKLYAAV